MHVSELALKKLNLIFPGTHEKLERRFILSFVLDGINPIKWEKGISIDDFTEFTKRCFQFEIRIIGIETHMDSKYPFYSICYEDFTSIYRDNWTELVHEYLVNNRVNSNIIPIVDISAEIIEKYLTNE